MPNSRKFENCDRLAVLILALLHVVLLSWSASVYSPTFDEPAHLNAGLSHLSLGRFELYSVNPPLIRTIGAIPAALLGVAPVIEAVPKAPHTRAEFFFGSELFWRSPGLALQSLRLGRILLIPVSLLGMSVCYLWGLQAFGRWEGVAAAYFWCFSPMILGHGSLITADVASASFGVLSAYLLRSWVHSPTLPNAVRFGGAAGICLITKFTFLVFLPFCVIAYWLIAWHRHAFRAVSFWRIVFQGFTAMLFGLLIVNSLYGFDGTFCRLGEIEFISDSLATQDSGEKLYPNRFSDQFIGKLPVPLPRLYVQGVDVQRFDFEHGVLRRSYLMGKWQMGGWWYYYIIAYAVKTPAAQLFLLAFALLGLAFSFIGAKPHKRKLRAVAFVMRRHRETLYLLFPVLIVFVLVSSETGFNRHLRYALPAYPFLFLLSGSAIAVLLKTKARHLLLHILFVFQTLSVLAQSPHWISYFNEPSGGSYQGSRWLGDSNTDWGQDLLYLKHWQQEHPTHRPLYCAVQSLVDPTSFGIDCGLSGPTLNTDERAQPYDGPIGPKPGWHAISVNALMGERVRLYDGSNRFYLVTNGFAHFKKMDPEYFIGHSIRIFYISPEQSKMLHGL